MLVRTLKGDNLVGVLASIPAVLTVTVDRINMPWVSHQQLQEQQQHAAVICTSASTGVETVLLDAANSHTISAMASHMVQRVSRLQKPSSAVQLSVTLCVVGSCRNDTTCGRCHHCGTSNKFQ